MRAGGLGVLAVLTAGAVTVAVAGAGANPGSLANGRAIYQTGRDLAGKPITAVPRPGAPSCAACHGANGAGGKHFPGGAISADLRHGSLLKFKPPYTEALVVRAISTGLDNEGKPVDKVMPRWRMSKTDLLDVAHYVWTQLK